MRSREGAGGGRVEWRATMSSSRGGTQPGAWSVWRFAGVAPALPWCLRVVGREWVVAEEEVVGRATIWSCRSWLDSAAAAAAGRCSVGLFPNADLRYPSNSTSTHSFSRFNTTSQKPYNRIWTDTGSLWMVQHHSRSITGPDDASQCPSHAPLAFSRTLNPGQVPIFQLVCETLFSLYYQTYKALSGALSLPFHCSDIFLASKPQAK